MTKVYANIVIPFTITKLLQFFQKIRTLKDIGKLKRTKYVYKMKDEWKWDFRRVLKDYDAIELENSFIGHMFYSGIEVDLFNSWDCESIVVLNPDKILVLD